MKFDYFTTLLGAASLAVVEATPLIPQPGQLQMQRRRAVDYVQPEIVRARKLRHRAVNYSVVPVYGSSGTTTDPGSTATAAGPTAATATIIKTIEVTPTVSVAPAATVTDVVSDPAVTRTLDVTQSPPPQTVTVEQKTTVIVSFPTVDPIPTTATSTQIVISVETTHESASTITVAPLTTTKYYDNGQWHTSYPVKSFPSFSGWLNTSAPASEVTVWKASSTSTPSWDQASGNYITSSWTG